MRGYVPTAPGTTVIRLGQPAQVFQSNYTIPALRTKPWLIPTPASSGETLIACDSGGCGPWPRGSGGPSVPPNPTAAWLVPSPTVPATGPVRIALPKGFKPRVPGPWEFVVPPWQDTLGPAVTDRSKYMIRSIGTRHGLYLPRQEGWISTTGKTIYNLKGASHGGGWGTIGMAAVAAAIGTIAGFAWCRYA